MLDEAVCRRAGSHGRRDVERELGGLRAAAVDDEDGEVAGLLVVGGGDDELVHRSEGAGVDGVAPQGRTQDGAAACFAVRANGWKMLWRQAGPPARVTMGAMTLTSCAWQAIETRSVCCRRVMSRLPTTTASVTS